ncbi:MAG: PAS domain S-box protein, partial [Pseudomonadota bacterium]
MSGANLISNDFLNDPEKAPWCEAARRAGVRASAKFPIREGGAVVGAINLYAGEPGFFTEDLVATLDEMASDVSFALDNYAREAARKQAGALLEKSEQRYRTIIQTAIDGFCIVDTEGRFLEMNDAHCRLLGYQREELLKMHIPDVDAIKTPEDIARHLREIVRKGYDHFVSRLRRKDGQLLDIEFSANLMPDSDRQRLFVFMRDITARKRAEEALAKSETRYRSLFENMLHGFAHCRMLFDDNRPQDFIYLEVNIAYEKLTGLKNVVGKRVTEVIPGIREAHPELFETYGRVALTGQPEQFELYFKPLESWLSLAGYSTGEGTFVAIFDNITERKRAEQKLLDYAGRLQSVSRRLIAVQETERRNINRELHDRVGQSLSGLNISLNIIRSQLPQESLDVVGARLRDTQT